MRPGRRQIVACPRAVAIQDLRHLGALGHPGGEAGGGLDDHGPAGGAPGGRVASPAADVVEAIQAKLRDQPVPLPLSGEIDPAVAREHQIEQPEVARHVVRYRRVGRGRQHHWPAAAPFFSEPVEQIAAVRQGGDVRSCLFCQAPLQVGFAARQPERHQQQVERASLSQHEERFEQQIAADQRAVEVDDQRHRTLRRRHRRPEVVGERRALRLAFHQKTSLASRSAPCFQGTRCEIPEVP